MGQARWAGTGTARESTAQERHGPVACVPVPGTAHPRARAWAANSAHGPARARHGKVAWPAIGTASGSRSIPLDGLWPSDPGHPRLAGYISQPGWARNGSLNPNSFHPPLASRSLWLLVSHSRSLGSRPLRRRPTVAKGKDNSKGRRRVAVVSAAADPASSSRPPASTALELRRSRYIRHPLLLFFFFL